MNLFLQHGLVNRQYKSTEMLQKRFTVNSHVPPYTELLLMKQVSDAANIERLASYQLKILYTTKCKSKEKLYQSSIATYTQSTVQLLLEFLYTIHD